MISQHPVSSMETLIPLEASLAITNLVLELILAPIALMPAIALILVVLIQEALTLVALTPEALTSVEVPLIKL